MREAVAQLRDNGTLRGGLGATVALEVQNGRPLSEALALFPDEIPSEDVAIVQAGEETGNLDRNLDRLALRDDARRSARRRFWTEALYPVLVYHFAAFLTPVPVAFARDGGLFGPTWLLRFLLVLSPFYAVLLGAHLLRRKAGGRALLRRVVRVLPGFGHAARRRRDSDLCEILGAAYESGMRIDRALEVAGRAVEDPRISRASGSVAQGRTLAESLAGAVPAPILARIETGERAGDLSRVLADLSREEGEASDHILRRSTQLLAKGFYIAVALWVLFYALSTLGRAYSFGA